MLAEADVLHDRVVEQRDVLEDHRIVAQQHLGIDGGDVDAAYLYGALRRVPQARRQTGAGALSRTRRPDQRRHLAFLCSKADTPEHLLFVVRKAHVLEHDVVPLGLECQHTFGCRRVVDFHEAVCGDLRKEYLRNHGQALVEWRIDARDDQQVQEQHHEVNLARHDEVCAHQDGGGDTEAHDDARAVHEQARHKLAFDHRALVLVDSVVQRLEVALLLVCGVNLAYVLECLLNAIGDCQGRRLGPLGVALGHPAASEQQREGHGHAPQARKGQPPVRREKHDGDDCRGNVAAVEVTKRMRPHVFHAVYVAHDRLGQIGQVAPTEKTEGELAQAFRQPDAHGLDFLVDQAIRCLVLLVMRDKGEEHKGERGKTEQEGTRQGRAIGERVHELLHEQIEDARAAHDHEVDDNGPRCALLHIGDALVRKREFALKLLVEQHARPPFALSRCAIGRLGCSRPTCGHTDRRHPPARRASPPRRRHRDRAR